MFGEWGCHFFHCKPLFKGIYNLAAKKKSGLNLALTGLAPEHIFILLGFFSQRQSSKKFTFTRSGHTCELNSEYRVIHKTVKYAQLKFPQLLYSTALLLFVYFFFFCLVAKQFNRHFQHSINPFLQESRFPPLSSKKMF